MKFQSFCLIAIVVAVFFSACKKEEADAGMKAVNQPIGNNPGSAPVVQNISRNTGYEKSFALGNRKFICRYIQLSNNQDAYVLCEQNTAVIWSR